MHEGGARDKRMTPACYVLPHRPLSALDNYRRVPLDWDEARPKPAAQLGEALATFSVGELEARIAALEAEIARVREELAKKKAHEAAAAALFKS